MEEQNLPDEAKDALAAMRAQTDQSQGATRELAAITAMYYKTLTAAGLPECHAIQLTLEYQEFMFGRAQG